MNSYLESVRKQFAYYKTLGEKTFEQLPDDQLFYQPNESTNSIAIIVHHLRGNMLSRWTDFLTSDGEKEWRQRDEEFEDILQNKEAVVRNWEEGWSCLFNAVGQLTEQDLEKEIYIRNIGHTVVEALNRQLAHYAYHIGQIVFIAKLVLDQNWKSLTIPKGQSNEFNREKFSKEK